MKMMRHYRKIKTVRYFNLVLWFLFSLTGIAKPPPDVCVSFPLLGLIVQDLSGHQINPWSLTPSGEDAHHIELGPRTLIRLQKTKLILINGLGLEASLQKWISAHPSATRVVVVSDGIKNPLYQKSTIDPHAWHSVENILIYVQNTAKALMQVDPDRQRDIESRAKAIEQELLSWKIETGVVLKSALAKFMDSTSPLLLVSGHNAFQYLASSWGFQSVALLSDQEGESISPRDLAERLIEIKRRNRRLFLGEKGPSSEVQRNNELLQRWAKQTNSIWAGELWSDVIASESSRTGESALDEVAPQTILSYMKKNMNIILRALTVKSR